MIASRTGMWRQVQQCRRRQDEGLLLITREKSIVANTMHNDKYDNEEKKKYLCNSEERMFIKQLAHFTVICTKLQKKNLNGINLA